MSLDNKSREDIIANILGSSPVKAVKKTAVTTYNSVSSGISQTFTPEHGSYFLQVLFYLFMYLFLVFLIAVFVHFTITPIFKFYPGGQGVIYISGPTSDIVYWNTKAQPTPSAMVPISGDKLAGTSFINNFSFSIDLFVRKITDSNPSTRLILYKSNVTALEKPPLTPPPGTSADDFISYMSNNSSMILYLTTTNDLVLTFFVGNSATNYSCPPIENVPLYTPFRISVVAEQSLFTLYLNGKQTFQRVLPTPITTNSISPALAKNQVFYASPAWANSPTQTVFVQNFHVWPRAITYTEVLNAQPALALQSDFGLPPEASSGQSTC